MHNPHLTLGSEFYTIKAKTKSRIVPAEMKFMIKNSGYHWTYYKTNTEILNELIKLVCCL